MTVKQKKLLDEKIQTGGGATGVAHTADPTDKRASLPASHLGNGESMPKIAHIQPGGGEEETDAENNVKTTKDAAGSNKASVSMKSSDATPGQSYSFTPNKPNGASAIEHVDAMFHGMDLSEEFKQQATVIFEAAVTAQVNEIAADLEEQYNTALHEEVARIEEETTTKVDEYMTYVVEQWMEENKVAIEHSLKSEITERFISDLKKVFEENYISVPEEQFDVVQGFQEELQEVQARLDDVMKENMTLKQQVNDSIRRQILGNVAEGLAATQAEKLMALAEGVDFDTADNYRKKLAIVKENYFPTEKPAGNAQSLLEEVSDTDGYQSTAPQNTVVAHYAKAISRTVKK